MSISLSSLNEFLGEPASNLRDFMSSQAQSMSNLLSREAAVYVRREIDEVVLPISTETWRAIAIASQKTDGDDQSSSLASLNGEIVSKVSAEMLSQHSRLLVKLATFIDRKFPPQHPLTQEMLLTCWRYSSIALISLETHSDFASYDASIEIPFEAWNEFVQNNFLLP